MHELLSRRLCGLFGILCLWFYVYPVFCFLSLVSVGAVRTKSLFGEMQGKSNDLEVLHPSIHSGFWWLGWDAAVPSSRAEEKYGHAQFFSWYRLIFICMWCVRSYIFVVVPEPTASDDLRSLFVLHLCSIREQIYLVSSRIVHKIARSLLLPDGCWLCILLWLLSKNLSRQEKVGGDAKTIG